MHENTQRPAVRDGVMDRENEHVIVGRAPKSGRAIKRPLHQVERLAEDFLRQFLDRIRLRLRRRKLSKAEIGIAAFANHLQWALFAREKRETQRFLPLYDAPQGRLAIPRGDEASDVNEAAADMVRRITDRDRRRFPQFALRKG